MVSMFYKGPEIPNQDEIIRKLLTIQKGQGVVIGMKETTQELDKMIRNESKIKVVFVCKADVPVYHMYSHLPTMCHLAKTILIDLKQGSEIKLAKGWGITTVLAFALLDNYPALDEIMPLIPVDTCKVDWLSKSDIRFLPTRVRLIQIPKVQNKRKTTKKKSKQSKKKVSPS